MGQLIDMKENKSISDKEFRHEKLKVKICMKCGKTLSLKEKHFRYCLECQNRKKSKVDKLSKTDFYNLKNIPLRKIF